MPQSSRLMRPPHEILLTALEARSMAPTCGSGAVRKGADFIDFPVRVRVARILSV